MSSDYGLFLLEANGLVQRMEQVDIASRLFLTIRHASRTKLRGTYVDLSVIREMCARKLETSECLKGVL